MEYEQRLTCFIDLLGFESAIKQSIDEPDIRELIHKIVHALSPDKIREASYADIPFTDEGGIKTTLSGKFGDKLPKGMIDFVKNDFPLEVTQFSDSYVISCPKDNPTSCYFLLRTIFAINLMYFYSLGMMMRGGIVIGSLIHEETGALFGPAMIESYKLESKKAMYPRILVSDEAHKHLSKTLALVNDVAKDENPVNVIKKSFDGYLFLDLISIFEFTGKIPVEEEKNSFSERLQDIEKDILESYPDAHPKISYLLNRWKEII